MDATRTRLIAILENLASRDQVHGIDLEQLSGEVADLAERVGEPPPFETVWDDGQTDSPYVRMRDPFTKIETESMTYCGLLDRVKFREILQAWSAHLSAPFSMPYLGVTYAMRVFQRGLSEVELSAEQAVLVKRFLDAGEGGIQLSLLGDADTFYKLKDRTNEKLGTIGLVIATAKRGVWKLDEASPNSLKTSSKTSTRSISK